MNTKKRCFWVNLNNPDYVRYHDLEWGRPEFKDERLFELLILEGAQAGLSWEIILKKRDHYRKLFFNFNITKCSKLTQKDLDDILKDPGIIRNRLKIYSIPTNAKGTLKLQKEFGSFKNYLWKYVDFKSLNNSVKNKIDLATQTNLSKKISKDLKKRGFKFVGPTIIYALMQASGIVNDHSDDCFCKNVSF